MRHSGGPGFPLAIAAFGFGELIASFSSWVSAGLEASRTDGIGDTTPLESTLMLVGMAFLIGGLVWHFAAHRSIKRSATNWRTAASWVIASIGLGFVVEAIVQLWYRSAVGAPYRIDFVTGLNHLFLTAGIVLILLGIVVALTVKLVKSQRN